VSGFGDRPAAEPAPRERQVCPKPSQFETTFSK